jgi:hypothetical protein
VDGFLFTAFSGALVSLYLGLEILLIHGVPFSQQIRTSAGAFLLPATLMRGFVAAALGVQYFLSLRRGSLSRRRRSLSGARLTL